MARQKELARNRFQASSVDLTSQISLVPVSVVMMTVVAVNAMPVVPGVRGTPVIAIVRRWPVVSIRIIPVSVTGIAVITISVTRITKPNSDSANPH